MLIEEKDGDYFFFLGTKIKIGKKNYDQKHFSITIIFVQF